MEQVTTSEITGNVGNCLATNIRHLRKLQNISQEELALRVGLNRGNIASYENGTAEPKVCNILKFAEHFRVNLFDLLGRTMEVEKTPCQSSGVQLAALEENMLPSEVVCTLTQRATDLGDVLKSFHTCHCFKMQSIDAMPREVQMLAINFEGLFEAAQALLQEHLDLIEFVKNKKL